MTCIDNIDICVIRGDQFELTVGLSDAFTEVIESPTAYEGRLVFREGQDDTLTPYLTLVATPEVPEDGDTLYGDYPVYMTFMAADSLTQSLPEWDHVAFCEIRLAGVISNPESQRLFNADVGVQD